MTPPEEIGAGNLARDEPFTEVFRFAKSNIFQPTSVNNSGELLRVHQKKAATIGDGLFP